MGRRALKKIDPSLDLSGWLFDLENIPRPLVSDEWFGRRVPLDVEVGSGKGLFLVNAAGGHGERDYLGIERARKYARYTAAGLAKRQLSNAKVVHGDALRVFHEFLPSASVAAVHVYFPDPWWKKRHRKRRVMTVPFLRDIERVLEPAGQLHFWTDVEEYFLETLEMVRSATSLIGPRVVPEHPAEHDLDYRTHFERRKRLENLPIHRAEFSGPDRRAVL